LVDIVTPAKRSEMMAVIKGKNTKPEILIRKLLHGKGFRFRLHNASLPGRPDIVLAKYKTAIFVQGSFWHGHKNCSIFRLPKSKTEFWRDKIGENVLRDERSKNELVRQGWKVFYVWECAVKGRGRLTEEQLKLTICEGVRSGDINFTEVRGLRLQPAL
jgi:DNA mismatch endonuclease (patch repair protein)